MSTPQGIKLDNNTRSRLKDLAEKRSRSPHWLMRTAIEKYLETEKRYEQEKAEDMARWEQYLTTGKAVYGKAAKTWLKDLTEGKSSRWPK